MSKIGLTVNGSRRDIEAPMEMSLLDVLRDRLELVGARGSCGIGMCGTCTVLIDGVPMASCLLRPQQVEESAITTVEGLADGDELHLVQKSYIEHAAFQCAYCTPGFLLTTIALVNENPDPDETTIREYLAGNLCRCGSYLNIIEAVQSYAKTLQEA